jgi:hypothetical protein
MTRGRQLQKGLDLPFPVPIVNVPLLAHGHDTLVRQSSYSEGVSQELPVGTGVEVSLLSSF